MKTLFLMRHAKSSWDDASLDDFSRPLNARGLRDAPLMGALLRRQGAVPELVVSSPAVRALSTVCLTAEAMGYPQERILTDTRLYDASAQEMLHVVRQWSDSATTALLVAHNPGLTNLVRLLAGSGPDNVPTAGIVGIECNVERWSELQTNAGKLRMFEYPKKYKSGKE